MKIAYKITRILARIKKNRVLKSLSRIETHLSDKERLALYEITKKEFPMFIIEIGSFLGASSLIFAKASESGCKIICIDTWENDAMTEGKRDTYQSFNRNLRYYREKIIPIRKWSYDALDDVLELTKKIPFLFIDGDHSYKGVKKDWDLYSPHLDDHAIVIFHDTGWAEGVKRVVEEDVSSCAVQVMKLPNMEIFRVQHKNED